MHLLPTCHIYFVGQYAHSDVDLPSCSGASLVPHLLYVLVWTSGLDVRLNADPILEDLFKPLVAVIDVIAHSLA
jgi:hypothetical protein